jgi:hypothetical protein
MPPAGVIKHRPKLIKLGSIPVSYHFSSLHITDPKRLGRPGERAGSRGTLPPSGAKNQYVRQTRCSAYCGATSQDTTRRWFGPRWRWFGPRWRWFGPRWRWPWPWWCRTRGQGRRASGPAFVKKGAADGQVQPTLAHLLGERRTPQPAPAGEPTADIIAWPFTRHDGGDDETIVPPRR